MVCLSHSDRVNQLFEIIAHGGIENRIPATVVVTHFICLTIDLECNSCAFDHSLFNDWQRHENFNRFCNRYANK